MSAKYLIRLDDACPTMNKTKWARLEEILDSYNIKPITAVVPNNIDEILVVDKEDLKFWDKVKQWQKKNWSIALHGYDHKYISRESGIVPFNNDSEFAGVSLELQIQKIKDGIRIFSEHGIEPEIFVAPSHSLDFNTLEALRRESKINIISDGLGIYPFYQHGFYWIPQQLWSFKRMPFGIWTICLHPNAMEEQNFNKLSAFLHKNFADFLEVKNVKLTKREKNFIDIAYGKCLLAKINSNRGRL